MNQMLKRSWDKNRHLIIPGFIFIFIFLLTVVYRSDELIIKKSDIIKSTYESSDFKNI